MSKEYDGPVRVGQLRPSQLIHSFGIGGLVDLPHLSVMINGLHDWDERRATQLTEERLLTVVKRQHGLAGVRALRQPPWLTETQNPFDDWAHVGVPVSPFPRWLRCPWGSCQYLGPIDDGQFEKSFNPFRPDQAAYVHKNCRKKGKGATGLPVRFMLACERGHLDEFPWIDYVHKRQSCESPLLEISERGQSSGPADVFVTCRTCRASRAMSDAFGERSVQNLPVCRGRHPHLGEFDKSGCDAQVRTLLLGASNAWFPVQLSVLSIPPSVDPLPALVEELWPDLERISDRSVYGYAIDNNDRLNRLRNFSDDEAWALIEARRAGNSNESEERDDDPSFDVLGPEWQQFTHPDDAPDTEDFRIRAEEPPLGHGDSIHSIVRAERLREVVAFTGFSRLSSPEEGMTDQIAPLSRHAPTWVPAGEVRGEGIFIRLNESAIQAWEKSYRATERYEMLFQSHKNWRQRRNMEPAEGWPGARYVLLHTLSHLLIREFALDCGYSASSIRERIYCATGADPMAGILLYTAAPDSEGTLGGLVSLGRPERLGQLFDQGLENAHICTSDPTCAEHAPGELGDDHVHGAACHACMFASETSCERGNRYLDRAALVETVAGEGTPFFGSQVGG
jgi:hypothetical protein